VSEEDLADATRGELDARVTHETDTDDRDVDVVFDDARNPTDRALGDTALADDPVDARDDLGAVRQRHGALVEGSEVLEPEIHLRSDYLGRAILTWRPLHETARQHRSLAPFGAGLHTPKIEEKISSPVNARGPRTT
jgi:hypothetical protein